MTWKVTVVHWSDDVVKREFPDFAAALNWAYAYEHDLGHSVASLAKTFHKRPQGSDDPVRVYQYGTNYHYVTIEEVHGG